MTPGEEATELPPHAVELRALGGGLLAGLADDVAARRLAEVGPNALVEPEPPCGALDPSADRHAEAGAR